MKEISIGWQLLIQVWLIALNAVFACAEIAFLSVNDKRIENLAEDGNKKASKLGKLTEQPAKFLSTIQVAITLSGFLGSAFAADNFSSRIVDWLVSVGVTIPTSVLNTISLIVITLILSFFTLVFGELVPKRLAMKQPEKIALALSGFISTMASLFRPVVALLTASTNGVLRLLGIDPNENENEVTEEEIRLLVDAGSEKGAIDDSEKEWIQNVFEFDDITAGEVATHRTDLIVLWEDETPEQWKATINETRHTIYPMCGDDIDDIVGILNTKDYFRIEDKTKENIMRSAVSPAHLVPESIKADSLFESMKKTKNHFAVVLDEYGGVTGIVTVSDLLEELVGDLDDNVFSPQRPEIEKIGENRWIILGQASLDDVSAALCIELPVDEYDTFGGFVLGTYGAIPADGEAIEVDYKNMRIRNIDIREHRVESALILIVPERPEEEENEEKSSDKEKKEKKEKKE